MELLNMHGGNVELLAPQYGFQVGDVLDFSANINPYGPPPGTRDLLSQRWQDIARYPDPHSTHLRAVLARWHNVQTKNITVANGASELIYWIARLFHAPKALVLGPTFTEYSIAVQSADGDTQYEFAKGKDGFRHVFKNVKIGSDNRINLVFVGNPNNPTGTMEDAASLQKWIKQSLSRSPNTLFVIDESFLPFAGPESLSLAPFAVETPGVIILRSMTKIFSIPGLRLGYAVSQIETAKKLERLMPTWRVNILAQRFGEEMFSFAQFINHSRIMLESHRNDLIGNLRALPHLKAFDSAANFVLIKMLAAGMDAVSLASALAKKGILVRSCNDFAGLEKGKFIRVAVRKPEENKILVQALKEQLFHAG